MGDLEGLAKNGPMIDGAKYEPTKVRSVTENARHVDAVTNVLQVWEGSAREHPEVVCAC